MAFSIVLHSEVRLWAWVMEETKQKSPADTRLRRDFSCYFEKIQV